MRPLQGICPRLRQSRRALDWVQETAVIAAKRLTVETVNFNDRAEVEAFFDQIIASGMVRVRAEMAELRVRRLMDSEGRMTPGELPPDMREDSGLDFGG